MRELLSHKVNPANDTLTITVIDEPGHGGACHDYHITGFENEVEFDVGRLRIDNVLIQFQNGPIAEVGVNGITHEALLAILIDRLEAFQSGEYACQENGMALQSLRAAQYWLHERTKGRMARGVEGTHEK